MNFTNTKDKVKGCFFTKIEIFYLKFDYAKLEIYPYLLLHISSLLKYIYSLTFSLNFIFTNFIFRKVKINVTKFNFTMSM